MIMCRKQCFSANIIVDIFDNRLGKSHSVICARAATNFIQKDKADFCRIFDSVFCLKHFDHKCTLPTDQVITSSDTRENLIKYDKLSIITWDETTDLPHNRNKRDLAHIRAFAGHIWPGYKQNTSVFI